jgi:uncharacterized membrane protein
MATSKSQSLSKALASKLAQQKALAPDLLPKTRWCAAVVLAHAAQQGIAESVAQMKACMGSNWSPLAAFQYMSGKQAQFCAECAAVDEQLTLLQAQRIAAAVCQELGKGNPSPAALQALAARHAHPGAVS